MKKILMIWKNPSSRKNYVVGNLIYNNNEFTFKYVNPELEDAKKSGFSSYPGFDDLKKEYHSKELFSNILGRLPNKTRNDYIEILNYYDLEKNSSDLEILLKTKGRLITDFFEFVEEFNPNKIEFEIAGIRYSNDLKKYKNELKEDMKLELKKDNYKDEIAVKIYTKINNKSIFLGYVPRYYAKDISILLDKNIKYSALIKKVRFNVYNHDEYITASVKLLFN